MRSDGEVLPVGPRHSSTAQGTIAAKMRMAKPEVPGLRFNTEIADPGTAACCVYMDTSHYQRWRVIEISFFLCKLNVASSSLANCEYVPPVWQSSNSCSSVWPQSRVFIHLSLSKSVKSEDFLVGQENGNLPFSPEKVLIVISPHMQFFSTTPYLTNSHQKLHESVNKTIEIRYDFRLLSRNNP